MTKDNRPLSPHIQIYKPQIGSLTSILHRATGIFLYIGVVIISWAIVHYTYEAEIVLTGNSGNPSCDCIITKYALIAIVIAWAFALYYHLCNGIRHLFWDIGKGFDKKVAIRNGVLVLVVSTILTAASVFYVFYLI
jgi:succinate dehydrogenase / fumarate reductase cytochrome b subunit